VEQGSVTRSVTETTRHSGRGGLAARVSDVIAWSPDADGADGPQRNLQEPQSLVRSAGGTGSLRRLKSTEADGLAVSGVQGETDSEHAQHLGIKRDAELAAIDRLESELLARGRTGRELLPSG
jgi:hypothetical protein